MVVYMVLMGLGFHLFVCFYEERTLTRRYGEEYLRFKRHVPRWLPRLTPWQRRGGVTREPSRRFQLSKIR